MDETTETCPICLEDFNTDDPDKIPYRLCKNSHFSCKGCSKSLIKSHYTNRSNVSITTNISDSAIKLVCQYDGIGENSLSPCIKCPMCRNPIRYDFKKLRRNNQSWVVENTFTFDRAILNYRYLETNYGRTYIPFYDLSLKVSDNSKMNIIRIRKKKTKQEMKIPKQYLGHIDILFEKIRLFNLMFNE